MESAYKTTHVRVLYNWQQRHPIRSDPMKQIKPPQRSEVYIKTKKKISVQMVALTSNMAQIISNKVNSKG